MEKGPVGFHLVFSSNFFPSFSRLFSTTSPYFRQATVSTTNSCQLPVQVPRILGPMKRTPFHTQPKLQHTWMITNFYKKKSPTENQLIPTRFHCETSFGILCSSFFRIPPLADCLPNMLDYRSFLPLGLA